MKAYISMKYRSYIYSQIGRLFKVIKSTYMTNKGPKKLSTPKDGIFCRKKVSSKKIKYA